MRKQKNMNIKTTFWFSVIGIIGFSSTDCLAQKTYIDLTDSLLAQGTIEKSIQSFYIKPIFEQYRSLVTTQGDGFSAPNGDLVRKRGFGIRIGYSWKNFELETGLSSIRPAAGYRYLLAGSFGHTTRTISTDFYHLPVLFRYRFWQPTNKLSLRIGAGVAYNVDLDKLSLAIGGISEESTQDANGNKVVLARTRDQYEKKKSFFSGEVNLSAQYQFSRHFSASLEARRIFGPADALRLTATQERFNPSSVRTVDSNGGTNSFSLNVGLAYQFSFQNRYQLK